MTTLKAILNNPLRTPWKDNVRALGKLTVFLHDSLDRSSWGVVFRNALDEFNQLSARHQLGVTMEKSTTPPADNGGGSDVQVEVPAGQPEFTLFGIKHVHDKEPFSRIGLHGLTLPPAIFINGFLKTVKAFVFVPGAPSFEKRLVGDEVKRHIAIHEFIHVCGLSNLAHTRQSEANPGVFLNFPGTSEGKTAADDRIKLKDPVILGGVVVTPAVLSPPITLAQSTIGLVQENWER